MLARRGGSGAPGAGVGQRGGGWGAGRRSGRGQVGGWSLRRSQAGCIVPHSPPPARGARPQGALLAGVPPPPDPATRPEPSSARGDASARGSRLRARARSGGAWGREEAGGDGPGLLHCGSGRSPRAAPRSASPYLPLGPRVRRRRGRRGSEGPRLTSAAPRAPQGHGRGTPPPRAAARMPGRPSVAGRSLLVSRPAGRMGGGGSALRVCADHRGGINWLSLSPDGQRLLTGSEDGTARLWSTADGQCCALLQGTPSRRPRGPLGRRTPQPCGPPAPALEPNPAHGRALVGERSWGPSVRAAERARGGVRSPRGRGAPAAGVSPHLSARCRKSLQSQRP